MPNNEPEPQWVGKLVEMIARGQETILEKISEHRAETALAFGKIDVAFERVNGRLEMIEQGGAAHSADMIDLKAGQDRHTAALEKIDRRLDSLEKVRS